MTRPNSDVIDWMVEDETLDAELNRLYATVLAPPRRGAMDQAIHARMAAPPPARVRRLQLPRLSRVHLALGAAVIVILGGLGGISHLNAPTTASAQAVLHRAAAVRMPPNEALHLSYAVTVNFPGQAGGKVLPGGTADVWIESDGSGSPVRSSQTLTLAVKNLSSHYIQEGGETYSYNPELRGDNTVAIAPESRIGASWLIPNHMFDGASVAAYLNGQAGPGARLLPQQTVDGHAVDVVQVDGGPNAPALRTTLYFDAQTYLLRGFDAVGTDPSYAMPSWRARLTSEESMPVSSAPADVFKLNAPAARVELPAVVYFTSFDATFQSECHTSLSFKQAIVSGRTPLAVCQETNPSVTESELVDALASAVDSDLQVALNAGQITSAQESAALQDLKAQIAAMVTSSGPPKSGAGG
jgi:hypothetical protein